MTNSLSWTDYVLDDYSFVTFGPDMRVLDVGCGGGAQLDELRRKECRTVGIEPDWACLIQCQKQGLTVVQARAEDIPVRNSSLDGVICKGVLPYTDEPRALQEISRVLKVGAVCHFADLGAGYYLRYLLCSPSWKFRFYGLRTLLNTWIYRATRRRLPGFLGDTIYQTRRRFAASYRQNGLLILQESPSPVFLGFPVFLYHSVRKVAD